MRSVYFSIPVAPGVGSVDGEVHMATAMILAQQQVVVRHALSYGDPYETALHKAMYEFLDGGEDYLLSMDSDNPPTRNPLELIPLGLDFIGLPTPIWKSELSDPWMWNVFERARTGYRPVPRAQGLQRVDVVGLGCFLASRALIEKVAPVNPFCREYDGQGIGGSCGFAFCERITRLGYPVHVHWDYPCRHYHRIDLLQIGAIYAAQNEGAKGRQSKNGKAKRGRRRPVAGRAAG